MLAGRVVYAFITLFGLPVCWFVLQSTAFCSAVGKARNQSPAEQPGADAETLLLSLSICLNGTEAQVGPLGAAAPRRCAAEDRVCSSLRSEVFGAEMSAAALAGLEFLPISSTVAAKFNPPELPSEHLVSGCINNSFCRLNGGGNNNPEDFCFQSRAFDQESSIKLTEVQITPGGLDERAWVALPPLLLLLAARLGSRRANSRLIRRSALTGWHFPSHYVGRTDRGA